MDDRSNNQLSLKAIGQLLGFTFNIPAYQRGYRWKANTQVKELLEDIWNYDIDHQNPDAYYCLQPVVVKCHKSQNYELIDGQQRLTTILLILHCFNETEFKRPKQLYNIQFETRIQQENFLEQIQQSDLAAKNIDLFHLHEAYAYIDKWFEEMEKIESTSIRSDFYSKLINKTKVIWYEIHDGTSVIDIFTRLNIGKIPLTNAELIKALFLSKSVETTESENRKLKQINIASEWDKIEQTLQAEDFWHFICPDTEKYATRIEFIFDVMKGRKEENEHYFTFHEFNKEFELKKDDPNAIDEIWLDIKKYFLSFEEWYQDQELYHLIGYLVATGEQVSQLKTESGGLTKTSFKEKLRKKVSNTIPKDIEELNYHKHKKKIKDVLLLFNVLSILKNSKSYLRFPFHYYHKQHWDLEHIRAQTSKDIGGKDQYFWAMSILWYFTGQEWKETTVEELTAHVASLDETEKGFCKHLIKILEQPEDATAIFNQLYPVLSDYFKEKDKLEDGDGLSNLTLLDQGTNRMYKNAFFPVKRKYIINREKRGIFIPLCTKNVFLKAYSQKLGEVMYWNNHDANDYLSEIKNILGQ